jgi:4-oxalocrotonate tautomerase family enzyme
MPMIDVTWAKGPNQMKKAEAARKIADAVSEATGAPLGSIWVNIKEVDTEDFFVGHDSLSELRRKRAEAAKAKV